MNQNTTPGTLMLLSRMLKLSLLSAAVLAAAQTPSKPTPLRLHLLGTGRACNGELRLTPLEFKWTTSFSRCRAPYKVISHHKGEWLLQIAHTQTSEKVCPYKIVDIRNTDPTYPHAQWEVSSFKSPEDRAATPKQPVYACTMQKQN